MIWGQQQLGIRMMFPPFRKNGWSKCNKSSFIGKLELRQFR